MEIKLEVPKYNSNKGIEYNWEKGFEIKVQIENGIVNLIANKEGLLSLANHLINLSQKEIPTGCHLHFDEYNSLEEGSVEIIIQKK